MTFRHATLIHKHATQQSRRRVNIFDATFALAIIVWMASLATMMHVGQMIAPIAIPSFVAGLIGHFTWRRVVLAAMGIGWAGSMLWIGFV